MTLMKGLIFCFVLKQGCHVLKAVLFARRLQLCRQGGKIHLVLRTKGRTHGYEIKTIVRANAFNVQELVKAVPQTAHKGKGSTQIKHLALNGASLGQASDSLTGHGMENAGG